jgi:hypothetical protein
MLDEITRDTIDSVIQTRQAGGVANATVNRTLSVIRAVLRKAALDWEWVDRYRKIRLLPEAKRWVPWLTQQEAEKLIAELPGHLAAMVRSSLETGLRRVNVTGLQCCKWTWCGGVPGFIRIRLKHERRLRCRYQHEPLPHCRNKLVSIRNKYSPTRVGTALMVLDTGLIYSLPTMRIFLRG